MTQMRLTIDYRQLEQALRRRPEQLVTELSRAIGRVIQEMARAARREAPKAFSTLVNAIKTAQPSPTLGRVVAGTDYARAVEEGTGIHGDQGQASGRMPPVQNIEDWLRVKGIQPRDPRHDLRDLAWMIAARIASTGTPAQPYLTPQLEHHQRRAQKLIDAAVARVLS